LATSNLFANGGSIVGNGAGLVESNFRYGYFLIGETISSCTDNKMCQLSPAEIVMLNQIASVIELNKFDENKIVFISEKANPGFFNTGENEKHRIAKTGLSPEVPIYINIDLLYNATGEVAIDFPAVIGILTHELGHQAGFTDESALDFLGSKIRFFLLSRMNDYKLNINDNANKELNILVINSEYPIKRAHIYFSWNQENAIEISKLIRDQIKCKNPNDQQIGYELINGYFSKEIVNDEVIFNAWIKNYCVDQNNSNAVKIESSDLKLVIKTPTLEIINLEIK
jgi:hypothetical protein